MPTGCRRGPTTRLLPVVAAAATATVALLVLNGCGAAEPTGSGSRPGGAVSSSAAPSAGGRPTAADSSAGVPGAPGSASPTSPTTPAATPEPGSELADSVTLRSLGFTYGPLDTLPVPRGSLVTARVDQPNVVTLVFVSPDAAGLYAFYTDTLPGAGYRIEAADAATATLSFSGSGWRGDVTGTGSDSALVLRPD